MERKSFEEEYVEMKEMETPDLWQRIETQLDDKPLISRRRNRRLINRMVPVLGGLAACVIIYFVWPDRPEPKADLADGIEAAAWTEETDAVQEDLFQKELAPEIVSEMFVEMPERIEIDGKLYQLEDGLKIDLDPSTLFEIGKVQDTEETEVQNDVILGASIYINNTDSIIIEWDNKYYLYHLIK